MTGFFGHFQKVSFSSGSGPYRAGWWGVVEKRKKTWKKPVFLGRWGVKNRQKSTKWVRGPPYSPQKTAIFGDFCQNGDFWKSRNLNPEIIREMDPDMPKNAKNAKNGPKPTFFKKCHFDTFWHPGQKWGRFWTPLKIRGLKTSLGEQRENGQNMSKKGSKMTPKMTQKTPFRPLFNTSIVDFPLEKGRKWQKGGQKVQKKWKKG